MATSGLLRHSSSSVIMAAARDSDIALWLHNKLGTSSDTWSEGSICSQLNLDVLRNIKECFMELQTQVKLKLLLSFFHIPKRNVEEVSINEVLRCLFSSSKQLQWQCGCVSHRLNTTYYSCSCKRMIYFVAIQLHC